MSTPQNATEAGRSDREVIANIVHDDQREQCDLDPEGFYDCEQLADRILAAGFHRAHRGETVAPYNGDFDPGEAVRDSGLAAERDAAIRERDEAREMLREMLRVFDQRLADVHKKLTSERAALAERLEAALTGYECKGCQASFRRENVAIAIARAEAAEARLRKPTDGGTITAEDYWRERARAEAAEAKHAAELTAHAETTGELYAMRVKRDALADALNQIGHGEINATSPADALHQVVEYARAALARNQEAKP